MITTTTVTFNPPCSHIFPWHGVVPSSHCTKCGAYIGPSYCGGCGRPLEPTPRLPVYPTCSGGTSAPLPDARYQNTCSTGS